LGLALVILGFVGSFFASLIQAAVSRQREFLADASAVQFTRNPAGLSSALQKIGSLAAGSQIEASHAQEASHMFFSDALGASAFSGMATHPPLAQRIRAIDPGWDGRYPRVTVAPEEDVVEAILGKPRQPPLPPVISGALGAAVAAQAVRVQTVLPSIGNPTPLHLRYAEELREALPEAAKAATRNPLAATALVHSVLLSNNEELRTKQLEGLMKRIGSVPREALGELIPAVAPLAARARLPLIELALPALRELSGDEYQAFTQTLKWLIASDRQVDLFEFVLQRIVARQLEPHFTGARPPVLQFHSLGPVLPDCTVILSALAQLNQPDQAAVMKAFGQGWPYLRSGGGQLTLLSREQCGLAAIDAALTRLATAVPQIKKNLLDACIHVVGADGVIQEREAELLRAIADSLDCPIPPFVRSDPDWR
jgi:uncharacterized tellurite resistance protein B-like protein